MSEQRKLFIDVRSGSIGAALINSTGETKSEILFCKRLRLPLQMEFVADRLQSSLLEKLNELFSELHSANIRRPDEVHITIGAPWQISQTRLVVNTSETSFRYDENFAKKILLEEEDAFKAENFRNIDAQIIEQEIISIELNGYKTDKPMGKLAKELKLSSYLSAISKHLFEAIENRAQHAFHHKKIDFHTFPILALVAGNKIMKGKVPSYLMIDIGGEVSEASLIRDGIIINAFSFPLGAHSVIREIAQNFKSNIDEAESMYEAFLDKRISLKLSDKIKHVLSNIQVKWTAYTRGILEKIALNYILPQDIVILGIKSTSHLFSQILDEKEIAGLFSAQTERRTIIPEPKDLLRDFYARPGTGRLDLFLSTEIFAIEKLKDLTYN